MFLIGLIILFAILVLSTLVPCRTERPPRKVPYITWGLIVCNAFLFLTSVFVSQVFLPADRIQGEQAIVSILVENESKLSESERELLNGLNLGELGAENETLAQVAEDVSVTLRKAVALKYAAEDLQTEEDLARLWRIQHSDSSYVLEPHYSVLNLLAYRPAEESIPGKLVGLLGSMFLHGSFAHLISNMIFLFVFGRALEDALGSRIYLGAYILCGFAAALLHHVMAMAMNPDSMLVPYIGASGAIGGVLGLFALRFYRTTTTIFLAFPLFIAAAVICLVYLLATGNYSLLITNLLSGNISALETIYAFMIVAAFLILGPENLKPTIKIASAWAVGLWVVVFNLLPILQESAAQASGGTAYWAHIGGFLLGSVYGLLIGTKEEGKTEFMLDDAEKAYDLGDMAGAIAFSQNLLEREPGNPGAYDVMARAWMKQNSEDEALDNFESAIQNYLRISERGKAADAYLAALEKYPRFILPAPTQLAVGNQMAKNFDYKNAAETLVKIPYTFPEAGEGEVALLRAAQIYIQHLGQPQTGQQLLKYFWEKFPESQWMPQVERAWKMAQHQLSIPAEPEPEPEPVVEIPAEPARARPQAVAPPLELEPAPPGNGQSAPPRAPRPPGK